MTSWGALIGILGGRGVCRPVLQVLTLFQTKKCHFPHRFKTWPVRNYVTITVRRLTLKRFLKTHFEFAYMILTPVVPSKTIPEYRPNRAKVYARFQTKTAKKPYPLGRHIYSLSGWHDLCTFTGNHERFRARTK